jgi:hypothetical protein
VEIEWGSWCHVEVTQSAALQSRSGQSPAWNQAFAGIIVSVPEPVFPSRSPLDKTRFPRQAGFMGFESESPFDSLWQEYARVFQDWDDLTLARWLAQTLGQFAGHTWRASHPLVGAYLLAAKVAHDRQIWFKRLATPPAAYAESPCCRAPFLPLLTRDVRQAGLLCEHCNETLVPFDEIPEDLRAPLLSWALKYEPIHAVAHWDDRQRRRSGNYDDAFETAAKQAEDLLQQAGRDILPGLLDAYAAVIWEDQDECLEVRPEDVSL